MAVLPRKSGGIPLIIIGGVHNKYIEDIRTAIKKKYADVNNFPLFKFHFISATQWGNYVNHNITQVFKKIETAVLRNTEKTSKEEFSPNRITLIYVESEDEAKNKLVLEKFFSFASLQRIPRDTAWDTLKSEDIVDIFISQIDAFISKKTDFAGLYLLLPLRNFYYAKDKNLFELCFDNILNEPEKLPLPKNIIQYAKCQGKSQCLKCPANIKAQNPQDSRGLCFVRGAHGYPRIDKDASEQSNLLNALYRFGNPIERSMHFDVQFPKGKKIREKTCYCITGKHKPEENTGGCAYLNIYPNDFIRTPK